MLTLAFVLTVFAANDAKEPGIWMCHSEPQQLVAEGADWDTARENLAGVKLYVDWMRKAPMPALQELAQTLKTHGIEVAVECGGTLDFGPMDDTNGEWSAEHELRSFRRYAEAGGRLDYLDIDGPVRRLLYPIGDREGFTSMERCAEELIDYMQAVLEEFPEIRFFLLTNFPNWGYEGGPSYHGRGPNRQDWGDYGKVLDVVLPKLKAAGMPLAGLTVDTPYEYVTGVRPSAALEAPQEVDWLARVRELEERAEAADLDFNLIVNSEEGGNTSAELFAERTRAFVKLYETAGGSPARYVVQSWYPEPKKAVPESQAHTMTWLVNEAAEALESEPAAP
jgi:hypothetical protein